MDLTHPVVQSVVAPLLVTVAWMGACAVLARGRFAAAAVPAGALVTVALVAGEAGWPPASAIQKLPWIVAALLLAALVGDATSPRLRPLQLGMTLLAGVLFVWLGWTLLGRGDAAVLLRVAAVLATVAVLGWRCARAVEAPATPAVLLAWASAGLAAVAVNGGSLVLGQCAGGLAVAAGVFAAAAVFLPRLAATPAASVAGAAAWTVLAGATLVLTDTAPLALALLPVVFFADLPVRRLRGGTSGLVGALLTTLVALPLVAAATWLATGSGAEPGLYYQ